MISKLKASERCSDFWGNLEAECHSSEESKKITNVQESKSEETISYKKDKNDKIKKPLDLSASTSINHTSKRGRSSHSSLGTKNLNSKNTKGGSEKFPVKKQGSRSMVNSQNLRMFVESKLDQYKNEQDKYNGIIRILADVGFLQLCYFLIKGKPGNMNIGATKETIDGIRYEWFVNIADEIKKGGLKFTRARTILISKRGKKQKRVLLGGVGLAREKIIQKGMEIILETIFEPKFLDCSHGFSLPPSGGEVKTGGEGFRPKKSAHSALKLVYLKGHHHTWVIQGDISKCLDKIPHQVIMDIIKKRIVCDRFLYLLNQALKFGFIDPKTRQPSVSNIGIRQDSIMSSILINIVLHELDNFVEDKVKPENNKGLRRKTNPKYNAIAYVRDSKNTKSTKQDKQQALKLMRNIPRMDVSDPNFRRSLYIRYLYDYVYLFEGPKQEALKIKQIIIDFLEKELKLELNTDKTVVSHISEGFLFLGAHIKTTKNVDYRMKTKSKNGTPITMRANVRARINMPTLLLIQKYIKEGIARHNHLGNILAKPMTKIVNLDHATIIQFYNSKIHRLLNYYSFAGNRIEIQNLIWIMRLSLAKTLARKYKLRSARQAFKKFGPFLKDPNTEIQIFVPKSLPTIHKYNINEQYYPSYWTTPLIR